MHALATFTNIMVNLSLTIFKDNSFYSVDEFNEFYYIQKRGKKKEEEEVLN
jgi:hypothetical protein